MKVISEPAQKVLAILGKQKPSDGGYRLIKYCVQERTDEGVLLFNTLTRELVLLTESEYDNLIGLEALKERWFVVSEGLNEKEKADMVKWVLRSTAKRPKNITTYTILTTTDCNARCFYCFEKGRSRIPMSEETAHKTARYIKEHCGGERVKLSWFGGEPLFNRNVIDTICEELRVDGVEYSSIMASNGYLFDEESVEKAKTLWNLNFVQITLDGTESVYNRSKAYIYQDGVSPYQVVMGGVERLLDSGIAVVIRLNLDLYNAENLMELVNELAKRFAGKKGLSIYAHPLFDAELSMAESHTDEEWERRYDALYRLKNQIIRLGLDINRSIRTNLKPTSCMADSGDSLIIAPTGEIGLCDHYTDSEFIGRIDREGLDLAVVESWRELTSEIPECADCFLYPECLKLKRCPVSSGCFRQFRESKLWERRQAILQTFRRWQQNAQQEEGESEASC